MTNKTKLILFAAAVIVIIIAGILISMNDLSNTADEKEKVVEKEEKKKEKKEKQKPILELTQESIELEIGSTFYFQDFIKKAEDEYGYNLKDKVKIPKSIPTELAGEYQVDYELSLSSGKKIVQQLKVKIIDFDASSNPD